MNRFVYLKNKFLQFLEAYSFQQQQQIISSRLPTQEVIPAFQTSSPTIHVLKNNRQYHILLISLKLFEIKVCYFQKERKKSTFTLPSFTVPISNFSLVGNSNPKITLYAIPSAQPHYSLLSFRACPRSLDPVPYSSKDS